MKIVFSTYQIENKILAAAAEGNLLFINTSASAYQPLVPTVQNKVRLLTMALDTCHVVHTLTVMSTRVWHVIVHYSWFLFGCMWLVYW